MLLRDSSGRSVEFHLYSSSGVDFAEDWLNAGSSLVMLMALILLIRSITLLIMSMMPSMAAILILKASWMLSFGLCEGVFFCLKLLLRLMMPPSIACVSCAKLTVFLILPLSGSLCCLIIKTSFLFRPPKKNRPSVGSSAAEVCYYAVRYILSYAMPSQEVFRS